MNDLPRSLGLPPFRPLRPFTGGHAQTLAARAWPQRPALAESARHELRLSDGDRLVLIENRPSRWHEGARIALLIHGLTGCCQSRYMTRLSRKLVERGVLAIRLNLRNCGPGFGLARNPYHSGRSEDARAALEWLAQEHPFSPVTLIGFSLGGNISLKLAGEDGARPTARLDSVMAVSPPVDLLRSAEKIVRRENRLYDRHFVGELRRATHRLSRLQLEATRLEFPDGMNLMEFDELYTAPRGGFRSARDYYARASSAPLIPSIRVPTLILSSWDDPVLENEALAKLPRIPGVEVVMTDRGGHMGFLGPEELGWAGLGTKVRWMDRLLLSWLERNLK